MVLTVQEQMIKKAHYMASLVIVLSVTLNSTIGSAADPQCETTNYWSTFGEVSFEAVAKKDGVEQRGHYRFVTFKNGESLVEADGEGVRKRALQIPGSVFAYEGLAAEEHTGISAKNPFMFIEYVLAIVLGPLSSAFPCGIDSVPATAQQIKVTRDGALFEGSVVRLSDDQIQYRLNMEVSDKPIRQVIGYNGEWKKNPPAPYPDDFLITGWRLTYKNLPVSGVTTLGQARGLARAP